MRYALHRLLFTIPVLFGVSFLTFLMLHLVPGDPVAAMFVGQQYRQAIQRYYELQPGQPKLPPDVEALLEDRRTLPPTRHLRRAWRDPFGGEMQFIAAPDGSGIVGVRSGSPRAPLKRTGFPIELAGFEDAGSYAAWVFAFVPAPAPAGT